VSDTGLSLTSSSSIWTKQNKLSSDVPESSIFTSLLLLRTLNSWIVISCWESFFQFNLNIDSYCPVPPFPVLSAIIITKTITSPGMPIDQFSTVACAIIVLQSRMVFRRGEASTNRQIELMLFFGDLAVLAILIGLSMYAICCIILIYSCLLECAYLVTSCTQWLKWGGSGGGAQPPAPIWAPLQ